MTPPFPEHTSTHAVTAAAAATTLARELGDRHTFTVDSPIGVSRTYTRFSKAAYEEAVSRVYCGIHFRHGMNAGLAQGAAIAHYTFENLLRPLDYDRTRAADGADFAEGLTAFFEKRPPRFRGSLLRD